MNSAQSPSNAVNRHEFGLQGALRAWLGTKVFLSILLLIFSGVWLDSAPETKDELDVATGTVSFKTIVSRGRGSGGSTTYLVLTERLNRILPPNRYWTVEETSSLNGREARAFWKQSDLPVWPGEAARLVTYRLEVEGRVIFDFDEMVQSQRSLLVWLRVLWLLLLGVLICLFLYFLARHFLGLKRRQQ